MKFVYRYKILVIIILVLGFIACSSSDIPSKEQKEEQKFEVKERPLENKAPDFTLNDLQGNQVKLSELEGKLVVIVFTTTWCAYCRKELPNLKTLYNKFNTRGLEILNIDIQESVKKVSLFTEKYGLPFRTLLDSNGTIAQMYGVRGVPSNVLISKEGVIICRQCRALDSIVESLLGGEKTD